MQKSAKKKPEITCYVWQGPTFSYEYIRFCREIGIDHENSYKNYNKGNYINTHRNSYESRHKDAGSGKKYFSF